MNNLSFEQDNLESAFRNWIDSLVTVSGVSIKNGIKPNDQGFYDDSMVNGSDLESVLTDRSSIHNYLTIGDAIAPNTSRNSLAIPHDDVGSFSDASFISTDGGYASDTANGLFNKEAMVSSPKRKDFVQN